MKIFKLTSLVFSMVCLSVLPGCSTTERYYSSETIAPGRIHHYPRPTPVYPHPSVEVDSGRIHPHPKPFPEVDGSRMHH